MDISGHSHDEYLLGEFKDDQLQTHQHALRVPNDDGASRNIRPTGSGGSTFWVSRNTENNSGRSGTVTRGKRKGVTYLVKVL